MDGHSPRRPYRQSEPLTVIQDKPFIVAQADLARDHLACSAELACSHLVPNEVRYQSALHPDGGWPVNPGDWLARGQMESPRKSRDLAPQAGLGQHLVITTAARARERRQATAGRRARQAGRRHGGRPGTGCGDRAGEAPSRGDESKEANPSSIAPDQARAGNVALHRAVRDRGAVCAGASSWRTSRLRAPVLNGLARRLSWRTE